MAAANRRHGALVLCVSAHAAVMALFACSHPRTSHAFQHLPAPSSVLFHSLRRNCCRSELGIRIGHGHTLAMCERGEPDMGSLDTGTEAWEKGDGVRVAHKKASKKKRHAMHEMWKKHTRTANQAGVVASEFVQLSWKSVKAKLPERIKSKAAKYEEVLVTSIGFDTEGQGQIVEYDPAFLSRIGWMTNLDGTVFFISAIYWQFMWLMGIAAVYAFFSGPVPLVLDTMGVFPSSPAKLSFRLPSLKAQTFAVSLVGGLLGFLLSLFNTNGLDRWWKTRDCLGVVIGKSIDTAMMFSMYIRGYDEESDKQAFFYKKELMRYLNLAHILIYRQANSIDDLSDLEMDHSYTPSRQWITKEEVGLFQPENKPGQLGEAVRRRKFFAQQLEARPRISATVRSPPPAPAAQAHALHAYEPVTPGQEGSLVSRYVIVYYWMEELLSKASREGLLDRSRPEALWKMQENISKMRGAAADVFMYLYCKIPYIYVHLMTFLVKVYLIVIAAVAGSSLRMAWYLSRPADFMCAILMVFFMNMVYEGLLQIHIRLWNPLGFDINDYPQRRYQDYVWRASMQFLRKPEDILPSYMIPNGGIRIRPPLPDPPWARPRESPAKPAPPPPPPEEPVLVPFADPTL